MSKKNQSNGSKTAAIVPPNDNGNGNAHITTISNMYEDYFLDYASYVILERAVPAMEDGLKPVQRRILHAMYEKEDGRYHKVANIIGNTMQYHPHGDAAIGDALVNLGQKDLLIDTQGNWGDYRTGDSAAAPRYIEARLTKFALTVAFNPQTTDWQLSYDGRKKEPINLPMKFPLVLAQGADGIAVGLSTKILPHNFVELCKASIDILKEKRVKIYPDFMTGGSIDVSEYNGGQRGGRVKVRAAIEKADKNRLLIKDLPYGVTTSSLIDSIQKAVEKGKIKIKKIDDNTAEHVEIAIQLAPGVSPDVTIDALYAFSNCEVSISPNCCVIVDNKPVFIKVEELLKICTAKTKDLLRQELEIRQHELEEKWFFASLEKIFIENRIYHQIEECESWEEVVSTIYREMKKYVATPSDPAKKGDKRLELFRDLNDDDITRLTEIRIKRISKYNSFKADQLIEKIIDELEQVRHNLAHLVEYTIDYYQMLLDKFGKGRERRTKITSFETIKAAAVVANNAKLYVDRKEGFIGTGLRKNEFVTDCSDIDDIIVFRKDGKFLVTRIADKTFVGKNILHVAVWKKGDERTTYNMIYWDAKKGRAFAKRFNVTAITRDKEYDLTKSGDPKNKVLYFSANPNGEAELVTITLSPNCRARTKVFDYGFSDLEIKGRGAGGNIVTRYPVKKVVLKEEGHSTIGALKIWMDEVSGRLNTEGRGRFLGEFDTGEAILAIYKDGTYELNYVEMSRRYEPKDLLYIHKFDPDAPVSAVYFDGNKNRTMVKRFYIETTSVDQRYSFITDHKSSKLYYATASENPVVKYSYKQKNAKREKTLEPASFVDIKGWKALGKKLGDFKILKTTELHNQTTSTTQPPAAPPAKTPSTNKTTTKKTGKQKSNSSTLKAGDTVEFDVGEQGSLF